MNYLILMKFPIFKDVPADGIIPGMHNLCASFLFVVTRHLCQRVQRGMEYVRRKEIIPPDKQVLVSRIYKSVVIYGKMYNISYRRLQYDTLRS